MKEKIVFQEDKCLEVMRALAKSLYFTRNFELLNLLYEQGCPLDKSIWECSAWYGDLDMLRWARKNNCPWDQETCNAAAEEGHLEVLRWAIINNCPYDKDYIFLSWLPLR